jgi:outer membrane biosynthesis protein TonB
LKAKDKPAAVAPQPNVNVPAPQPSAPMFPTPPTVPVPVPTPAPAPAKPFGFFGAPAESPAPSQAPSQAAAPSPEKVPEKVPEAKKASKQEPVKATPVKEGNKGKERKTNGFKLFMSQMLMLGGFVGLGYATVVKGDEMAALQTNVNKALLKVGAPK